MIGVVTNNADVERKERGLLSTEEVGGDLCFHANKSLDDFMYSFK